MPFNQTSLQNRNGVLFFTAMNGAFGSAIDTATVIPTQLLVVGRERASRLYRVLPYYLANFAVKMPLDLLMLLGVTSIQ